MSVRNFLKNGIFSTALVLGLGGGTAMAASGSIDREDGVVYITGDQWVDECRIYVDGDEVQIDLTVYDSDGEVDDFDDRDYSLNSVSLIIFEGFAGDDDFWNHTSIPCIAYGGSGDDVLLGGTGDDELHGGSGEDFLSGSLGDDDLYGGRDADWLYAGSGEDYLKAGTGEDEWVIAGQGDRDTFAIPATLSFWSRQFVPVQFDVAYYDFDPQQDDEIWFWASTRTNIGQFRF